MEENKELITVMKQVVKELKAVRELMEQQQTRLAEREEAIKREQAEVVALFTTRRLKR